MKNQLSTWQLLFLDITKLITDKRKSGKFLIFYFAKKDFIFQENFMNFYFIQNNMSMILQMEDECSIGNDETRIFILSSFASNKMNRHELLEWMDAWKYLLCPWTSWCRSGQGNETVFRLRVPCVVCSSPMTIYDKYPLVDGTLFLSPRQHNKTSIQVMGENFDKSH